MVDTLASDPSLKEMFEVKAAQPVQQVVQPDVNFAASSQKMGGIQTTNTLEDSADLASLNLQAAPASSSILGDCMDQVKKLGSECTDVVKPQLPVIQTAQVMPENTVAANNMSWTHKMDMTPGGMS